MDHLQLRGPLIRLFDQIWGSQWICSLPWEQQLVMGTVSVSRSQTYSTVLNFHIFPIRPAANGLFWFHFDYQFIINSIKCLKTKKKKKEAQSQFQREGCAMEMLALNNSPNIYKSINYLISISLCVISKSVKHSWMSNSFCCLVYMLTWNLYSSWAMFSTTMAGLSLRMSVTCWTVNRHFSLRNTTACFIVFTGTVKIWG